MVEYLVQQCQWQWPRLLSRHALSGWTGSWVFEGPRRANFFSWLHRTPKTCMYFTRYIVL